MSQKAAMQNLRRKRECMGGTGELPMVLRSVVKTELETSQRVL